MSNDIPALRLCPFCGGPAEIHKPDDRTGEWAVYCLGDMRCWVTGPYRKTQAEAIAAWNERKTDANGYWAEHFPPDSLSARRAVPWKG